MPEISERTTWLETGVLNPLGWELEDSQSLREMQNFR